MDAFRFDEKYLSQIPALQVLVNLGYRYLTPTQALAARGGKTANVLLEEVLRDQLKTINRIQHKGGSYRFSEENVQSAVQRLKNVKYDGLLKTNQEIYDNLLTSGVALEQSIEGDLKSFTLRYVDWLHPDEQRLPRGRRARRRAHAQRRDLPAGPRAVRQRHSVRRRSSASRRARRWRRRSPRRCATSATSTSRACSPTCRWCWE